MRSVLIVALLGAAAASGGGTLSLRFSDCGDSSTHAYISSLTPTTLALGANTSIAAKGTIDKVIESGTYNFTAKILGVPVQSHTGDTCKPDFFKIEHGDVGTVLMKGLKCPVSPGAFEVDLDVTIADDLPTHLPVVTVSIEATATNGDKVLCLNLITGPLTQALNVRNVSGTPGQMMV